MKKERVRMLQRIPAGLPKKNLAEDIDSETME